MPQLNDHELLLGYVDGELSAQDAACFEERMAGDQRLRQLAEQLRRDSQLLGEMPLEEPPENLVERIMRQRERDMLLGEADLQPIRLAQPRPVRANRLAKVVAYSGIAAAILLCASVVVVMLPDALIWKKTTEYDQVNGQLTKRLENINALERMAEAKEVEVVAKAAPPAAEETLAAAPIVHSKAGPPPPAIKMAAVDVGGEAYKSKNAAIARSNLKLDSDAVAQTYQQDGRTIPYGLAELTLPRNNFRVEVTTDNAPVTYNELNSWAMDNTVKLYPQEGSFFADSVADPLPGDMGQIAAARADEITNQSPLEAQQEQVARAGQQQVIVVIEPQQVPQLLARLNRRTGQRALLVADADDQDGPDEQGESLAYNSAPFAWGSVLENQLPLVTQTSLDSLRARAHLRLPILINQESEVRSQEPGFRSQDQESTNDSPH